MCIIVFLKLISPYLFKLPSKRQRDRERDGGRKEGSEGWEEEERERERERMKEKESSEILKTLQIKLENAKHSISLGNSETFPVYFQMGEFSHEKVFYFVLHNIPKQS